MDNLPRNHREPYVMKAVRLKNELGKKNFQSTYNDSFKNIPTDKCSPLITEYYEYYNNKPPMDEDGSPYILARDGVQPRDRKPYQITDKPPTAPEEQMYDPGMTRYENWTLKKDIYSEGLPHRDYVQREQDFSRRDPRDDIKDYQNSHPSPRDQGHAQAGYSGQMAGGPQEDGAKVFCNKCFKTDTCMNRLTCTHQYCDECMASIPVQDRQFRDSIRWHYCCEVCQKLTSDPKLVRVDPRGRRLLRYQDTNTFSHPNQPNTSQQGH